MNEWLEDRNKWREKSTKKDKSNIELFRENDQFSDRFFEVINIPNILQQRELIKLREEVGYSAYFGAFIYDNQGVDISKYFSLDYFTNSFKGFIQALTVTGTYESYISIIKNSINISHITFENPDPSHLIIRLTPTITNAYFNAFYKSNLEKLHPDSVQYVDSDLIFKSTSIHTRETVKMIELLNVNGVFVQIVFNK